MESTPCENIRHSKRRQNSSRENTTIEEKYNLRTSSLVSRVQSERKRNLPKQPKPKTRPPPLSKYRRKTANHRERERMKDMNDAFEALRKAVPMSEESDSKQTKVTTLKQALDYIVALRRVLGYECSEKVDSDSASSSHDSVCSATEQTLCEQLNSDGECSNTSISGISSGDESVLTDELDDMVSPFTLEDDICLDFDLDEALML